LLSRSKPFFEVSRAGILTNLFKNRRNVEEFKANHRLLPIIMPLPYLS
jgi:hypothetical protein